ncbi:MAG: hypothetical protein GYB64_15315 [Chloroflexi bacterium]|nr:hypothetical protein [Chloroflexota bacterium]
MAERLASAQQQIRNQILALWNNPLLHHARRANPLPLKVLLRVVPAAAGITLLLTAVAWLAELRPLGAAMMILSLAAVLLPLIAASVGGADRIARQMHFSRLDPRRLTDLDPREVTDGLALVTVWKLRWLIIIALAFTPALMLSTIRLESIHYSAWQASAEILGGSTAGGAAGLLVGGRMPVFRMITRALAIGVLPWALLPTVTVLGVAAALGLRDFSLSPLSTLLIMVVAAPIIALTVHGLTRTALLAGPLEILRLLIVLGLIVAAAAPTVPLSRNNARWLAKPPDLPGFFARPPEPPLEEE